MRIFGDKADFAIEVEQYTCEEKDIFFFCFWCHEKQIGDFDITSSIQSCIYFTHEFLLYSKNRYLKGSSDIDKYRLFYELYDGMFDETMIPDNLLSDMPFGYKRVVFHLDGIGQYSFLDKINIILVDEKDKSRQRLIWRDWSMPSVLHEEFLPLGCVDYILIEFINAFGRPIETVNDWLLRDVLLAQYNNPDLQFDESLLLRCRMN